jgi:hypothetical protein
MSVIWIVTTGNSDVKLSSSDNGYASLKDKDIKRKALGSCYTKFPLNKVSKDEFTLPARVMGIIYGDAITTHWNYFKFPLLDSFSQELEKKNVKPDRIIILLTDQEAIFDVSDRRSIDSPYWKDTCTLEPILERYLRQEFKSAKIEFTTLQPEAGNNGLDDWDATLKLVQHEFGNWNISKSDRVIVSHQPGTPAISSAVQLTSLIRFGKKVGFLVSSELNLVDGTKFLEGSSYYFDTLQIKKLEDLLEGNDYAGVERVVQSMELEDSDNKARLEHLLGLAKLWNAAEFEKFALAMGEAAVSRSQAWWWSAYESAYLGVVRLKQDNTVEAIFHSFRAVEGLLRKWAENTQTLVSNRNGNLMIELPSGSKFNLYGKALYNCFEEVYSINANEDIYKFGHNIFDKRNDLFHQLLGKEKSQVFDFWGTSNQSELEKRIINCLNSVSRQSFDASIDNPLKSASLMARVHEELVKEIGAIAKN